VTDAGTVQPTAGLARWVPAIEWLPRYHANDVIRGADLEPKLAYQPAPGQLPAVFDTGRR
jgi:hypothetical protein